MLHSNSHVPESPDILFALGVDLENVGTGNGPPLGAPLPRDARPCPRLIDVDRLHQSKLHCVIRPIVTVEGRLKGRKRGGDRRNAVSAFDLPER